MRSVIIVLAGAASPPCDILGGLTPLAAAGTPAIDRLTALARLGRIAPPLCVDQTDAGPHAAPAFAQLLGVAPGASGVAMTDAQARAAAARIELAADEIAYRLDFVTIDTATGVLQHAATPGVRPAEARELLDALRASVPSGVEIRRCVAGGDRSTASAHLVIVRGGDDESHAQREHWGRTHPVVSLLRSVVSRTGTPGRLAAPSPESFLAQPAAPNAPRGPGSDALAGIIECAAMAFADHPVNVARSNAGEPVVTTAWPSGIAERGAPRCTELPALGDAAGVATAIVGASQTAVGVAHAMRAPCIDPRDNAAGAVIEALERYGLVIVYHAAIERAAGAGDPAASVDAIEDADRALVAPILDELARHPQRDAAPVADATTSGALFGRGEARDEAGGMSADPRNLWRLALVADRAIDAATGTPHTREAPVAVAGSFIEPVVTRRFTEADADEAELRVDPPTGLIEFLLRSGMRGRGVGTSRRAP